MSYAHTNTSRAYQRKRKTELRAAGLCPWCGRVPPAEGRTRCAACLEIARQNSIKFMKRRRKHWKALGICGVCGKREAMPRQTRCGFCADRQDEYKASRRKGEAAA